MIYSLLSFYYGGHQHTIKKSGALYRGVPLVGKCILLHSTTTLLSVPRKRIFVDSLPPLSQYHSVQTKWLQLRPPPLPCWSVQRNLFTFLRDFIILTPTYDESPTHKICRCPHPESRDVREFGNTPPQNIFPNLCVGIIMHIILPGLRNVCFLWIISDKRILQLKTLKRVYIFVCT